MTGQLKTVFDELHRVFETIGENDLIICINKCNIDSEVVIPNFLDSLHQNFKVYFLECKLYLIPEFV